jgi:hypothetical protein
MPPSSSGTVGALEGWQQRPVWECILDNRPHAQGDTPIAAGAMPGAAIAVPRDSSRCNTSGVMSSLNVLVKV